MIRVENLRKEFGKDAMALVDINLQINDSPPSHLVNASTTGFSSFSLRFSRCSQERPCSLYLRSQRNSLSQYAMPCTAGFDRSFSLPFGMASKKYLRIWAQQAHRFTFFSLSYPWKPSTMSGNTGITAGAAGRPPRSASATHRTWTAAFCTAPSAPGRAFHPSSGTVFSAVPYGRTARPTGNTAGTRGWSRRPWMPW